MGLASLLGRRSNNVTTEDVSAFKATAYHSTTSALPPMLGTNPLPGNGVTAIGSNGIHILPQKRNTPKFPTNHSLTSFGRTGTNSPTMSLNGAAPFPSVPRLRSISSNNSRPNTAATDAGFEGARSRPKTSDKRSRRDSLRQSIAALKKSTSQGDIRASSGNSTIDLSAPPVPTIPSMHSVASDGPGRFQRSADTASISASTVHSGSIHRGAGYVDLLDASGEFRPSNFRSRVQATGARDYGEDVAERNILPAAPTTAPSLTSYYSTSDALKHSQDSPELDSEERRPRTVIFPKRVDSFEPATTSDRRASHAPQKSRTSSVGSHSTPRKPRSSSSHNYAENTTYTNQSPKANIGKVKHKPQPLNLDTSNNNNKPLPPIVSDLSDSESDAAAPPSIPRSRAASRSPADSAYPQEFPSKSPPRRTSRSSVLVATNSYENDVPLQSPTLQVPRSRGSESNFHSSQDFAPSHHARTESSPGKSSRPVSKRARKPQLSIDSFEGAAPAPGIPSVFRPSEYPQKHMVRIDSVRRRSKKSTGSRAQSTSRPGSSSSAHSRVNNRARSLSGGLALLPVLKDISEHIPQRGSSRRNWSLSSSTDPATPSAYSTDVFQRPNSRHTAETSVPPTASIRSFSLEPSKDIQSAEHTIDADGMIYYTPTTEPAGRVLSKQRSRTPKKFSKGRKESTDKALPRLPQIQKDWSPQENEFGRRQHHIRISDDDDDEDDDDDDDHSPSENSLLYREEGYGATGFGLPGIFTNPVAPTITRQRSSNPRPTSADSNESMQTMTYDDLQPSGGLRPPSTPSSPFPGGQAPPTPTSPFPGMSVGRSGGKLPAFETSSNDAGSDATEDSFEGKFEVHSLKMKMRRESKARERQSAMERKRTG